MKEYLKLQWFQTSCWEFYINVTDTRRERWVWTRHGSRLLLENTWLHWGTRLFTVYPQTGPKTKSSVMFAGRGGSPPCLHPWTAPLLIGFRKKLLGCLHTFCLKAGVAENAVISTLSWPCYPRMWQAWTLLHLLTMLRLEAENHLSATDEFQVAARMWETTSVFVLWMKLRLILYKLNRRLFTIQTLFPHVESWLWLFRECEEPCRDSAEMPLNKKAYLYFPYFVFL